jgi:O-antigen/teichoic acid export membrane protein
VSINRALGFAGRNVDNLILGIVAGATGLAFYNRAFRLIGMPQESINGPLTRIALPLLAQLRDRPAEFVRAFRHFNLTSMTLGLPAVTFLLVSTPGIVAIIFGSQWTPVVPLLRGLGLLGLLGTFLFSTGWVYVAMGNVQRQLRWETVNLGVLTAAFLIGVHWGAMGVAIAASLGHAVLRVPALIYCFRDTPLRLGDVGAVCWRPLLASAAGAGLVLGVRGSCGAPDHVIAAVAMDGIVLTLGYILGWILVPGWRAFVRHELRRPAATA